MNILFVLMFSFLVAYLREKEVDTAGIFVILLFCVAVALMFAIDILGK